MTREEFKNRIGAAEDGQTVILEDDGLAVSVEDGAGEGEILVTADIGSLTKSHIPKNAMNIRIANRSVVTSFDFERFIIPLAI